MLSYTYSCLRYLSALNLLHYEGFKILGDIFFQIFGTSSSVPTNKRRND